MGKEGKRGSAKIKPKTKSSEKNPGEKKKETSPDKKKEAGEKTEKPAESLEQLMHQKEEVQALLSSLEDAYSEATILEEDYDDIKTKNANRLEEIDKKIETMRAVGAAESPKALPAAPPPTVPEPAASEPLPAPPPAAAPAAVAPAPAPSPPVVVEKKPGKKEEKKEGAATTGDLKKMENDLAEKLKSMVDSIGARVSEKDVMEIKSKFSKFDAEMEKMKALLEATRESKKISDEKIQRVVEGLAEIRTTVYGREASVKENEIRMERIMDTIEKLEPEKLIMELTKRDKEMSDQKLRLDKLDETTKEFGEMLKRIEKLLQNVGSLENVIRISNDASEKLVSMQNIERSNQKMLDKIQGLYAELSKRMEEFMLYRAKQDRLDDLINDVLKSLDSMNTKIAYSVTRDDLTSFKSTIESSVQTSVQNATASIQAAAGTGGASTAGLEEEKSEIEMLMETMEEEFKSGAIKKDEYEKMRDGNLKKLDEINKKIAAGPSVAPAPPPAAPEPAPEKPAEEKKPEKKEEEPKAEKTTEQKDRDNTLLKDLEDTYKKGFISKEAYEKTKKMILGKG